MVLLTEEVMPSKWPLARVIKVYPGNDGIVRVADIRTLRGSYHRPVHKLAPLYFLLKLNNIKLLYVLNYIDFFVLLFVRLLV